MLLLGVLAAQAEAVAPSPSFDYGYIAGGRLASGNTTSIDKLTYSTDTISTLAATLSNTNDDLAGVVGDTYGLFMGSNVTAIDKFTLSTETISTSSATQGAYSFQAGCESSTDGYVAGGRIALNYYSLIQKFNFAAESRSTLAATLSVGLWMNSNGYASSTHGYWAGGNSNQSGGSIDDITKLDFSSDTASTLTAKLSRDINWNTCFESSEAGYSTGGISGGTQYTTRDKIVFGTETQSTVTGLSVAKIQATGATSGAAGFYAGGYIAAVQDAIEKFEYSTETRSVLVATLSRARRYPAAFEV